MVNGRLKMSLLPALKAILDTASVTHAAEVMHVTQSTMSRTLSQLRDIFNDPILTRDGNHISLSPKARQIQPLVEHLLNEADNLFENQCFNPKTCQHHFHISTTSRFQQSFLIHSLDRIRTKAPNLSFSLESCSKTSIKNMREGLLDLAILPTTNLDEMDLAGVAIVKGSVCILLGKGHPLVKTGIKQLTDLDSYPYISLDAPIGLAGESEHLKSLSMSLSNPWLRLNNQTAALDLIRKNEAFLISSTMMYPELLSNPEFTFLPLPVDFPPATLSIVWPRHWEFSHAHQWLRQTIEKDLRAFYRKAGFDLL